MSISMLQGNAIRPARAFWALSHNFYEKLPDCLVFLNRGFRNLSLTGCNVHSYGAGKLRSFGPSVFWQRSPKPAQAGLL